MDINEWLVGKTIKTAEVTGSEVILTFTDGNTLEYNATDGGFSYWELKDAAGNTVAY